MKQQGFAGMFLKESVGLPELPQEAVGKAPKVIAKMLEPHLKSVGIKLIEPAPIPGNKNAIWSVESSKYPDKLIVLFFNSKARGGRGIHKDRNLSLSFGIYDKEDKSQFEPTKMNPLTMVAAISYDGIGSIYKERVK